jgi:hypothetical protein
MNSNKSLGHCGSGHITRTFRKNFCVDKRGGLALFLLNPSWCPIAVGRTDIPQQRQTQPRPLTPFSHDPRDAKRAAQKLPSANGK